MFDIFAHTQRPSREVFYRRDDPLDPRLGEQVSSSRERYARSTTVILGCPQDEGVRRNRGRVGAADAPLEIRRYFYRLTPCGIDPESLFDLGDTTIRPTLEATHELHREVVRQILRDGKTVITLGGGNDIAYPDCAALADVYAEPLAFNIDAHFDVRADAMRTSGTPYRQLLTEGIIAPSNLYQMGYQPSVNSPIYLDYLRKSGVTAISLRELRVAGVVRKFKEVLAEREPQAVFWGFDIDSVRSADAPGVSAPNSLGFSGDELCSLAHLAGRRRATRIIEFTEFNPRFDIDHRTARLVAQAIHHFLTGRAEIA